MQCFCQNNLFDIVENECIETSTLKLLLFDVGTKLVLWPYAYIYWDPHSEHNSILYLIKETLQKPIMIAYILGIIFGLISPIHAFWKIRIGTIFIKALDVIGTQPAAGMSILIMSGSLGRSFWIWYDGIVEKDYEPNSERKIEIKITNIVNQERKSFMIIGLKKNLESDVLPFSTFMLLVGLKMFVLPCIWLLIIYLILQISTKLRENKLVKFILQLECIVPTANTCVNVVYQFGLLRAGKNLSMAIFFQYIISILSMTGFIAFFLLNLK